MTRTPEQRTAWNAYMRAYRQSHLDTERARDRARNARRPRYVTLHKFNLTDEQFQAMLEAQGGGCAVCGATPNGRALAIDHDHATGAIRGLLCDRCNRGLGYFHDDADLIRAAAEYLARQGMRSGSP